MDSPKALGSQVVPPRVLWSPHNARQCVVSDVDIRLWEASDDWAPSDVARRRVFSATRVLSVATSAQVRGARGRGRLR